MHIHMSYLTFPSFKILASNYLDIDGEHRLFEEIERMIDIVNVTPAQVAEELMRSEDNVDEALQAVLTLLRRKKEDMRDNEDHFIVKGEGMDDIVD